MDIYLLSIACTADTGASESSRPSIADTNRESSDDTLCLGACAAEDDADSDAAVVADAASGNAEDVEVEDGAFCAEGGPVELVGVLSTDLADKTRAGGGAVVTVALPDRIMSRNPLSEPRRLRSVR